MDSEEKRLAAQKERSRLQLKAWREKNPDRVRAAKAAYRERHRERIRQEKRDWIQKNPEKHREQSRRSAAKKRAKEASANRATKRAAEWALANPEKVKAYKIKYKDADPERFRRLQRESYRRNKEAILARQAQQRVQDDVLPRPRYDSRKEAAAANLAKNAERRRLARRLSAAGLPSAQVHKSKLPERRANAQEARRFFSETTPPADGPTPQRLLDEWEKGSKLIARRREQLVEAERYRKRNGKELREAIRMDSVALKLKGLPPLNTEYELWVRGQEAVGLARRGTSPVRYVRTAPRVYIAAREAAMRTERASTTSHLDRE